MYVLEHKISCVKWNRTLTSSLEKSYGEPILEDKIKLWKDMEGQMQGDVIISHGPWPGVLKTVRLKL
jgi:hypothetical protein